MSPEDKDKEPEANKTPEGSKPEQASQQVDGEAPILQDLKENPEMAASTKNIDFLYDIELDVNIELGRAELRVSDILSLQSGSVVELNRLAGDPVEIVVNNKLIARGEVIVIDDNFAVRVTDILSPDEIVTTLGNDY